MMGTYSDVKTFVSVKICGSSRSLRLKVHPAQVPGCAILSTCKPCEISYGIDMYIYIYIYVYIYIHILGTAFSNNPSKGSRKTRPFYPFTKAARNGKGNFCSKNFSKKSRQYAAISKANWPIFSCTDFDSLVGWLNQPI